MYSYYDCFVAVSIVLIVSSILLVIAGVVMLTAEYNSQSYELAEIGMVIAGLIAAGSGYIIRA